MNPASPIRLRSLATLIASLSVAFISHSPARELESFTFRLENDAPGGTDYHYTSGSEFLFAYQPEFESESSDRETQKSLALGQLIFTPQDLRDSRPILSDRPYAGWTYLRYGLHRSDANRLDSWQLTLGLVGPSSYAEDIQRAMHAFINDTMPRGWDHQMSDELGYAIERSRRANRLTFTFGNERQLQLSEGTRLSLGNVDTSLSQSVRLAFGKNLPDHPAANRIGAPPASSLSRAAFADLPEDFHPTRFYWILGAKTTYVAENLFLDGKSPSGRHQIRKHDFVHEAEAGFAYSKPGFSLSFLMVYQSEAFREQKGGQSFGSIAFTFHR